MDERRSPAILLGIDRLLGLQLARILWRHGIPVVGVAEDPASHHCRTRAARRIVSGRDFDADPEGLLAGWEVEYGARPVVIPCLDERVWWLDAHRALVSRHADFLLPEPEDLARLGDKARFYRLLIERGGPLPETRFVDRPEAREPAARELGLPLIVKPPRRSPGWMRASGGAKVLRVDDLATLDRLVRPLLAEVDELILQAWVEGGDDCMHSLFVCLDRESRPVVPCLVAHKLRQWPPDVGVGSLAEQVDDDALVGQALDLLQALRYVGTGSLQLKRDPRTDRFVVIEMNTRFVLNMPLFEACGVEATLAHYDLARGARPTAGAPGVGQPGFPRPGRRWICWKRDLASAWVHWRRGDLTLGGWLRSLRGAKWSADVAWDDPLPLLTDLARGVGRLVRRAVGRVVGRGGRAPEH